jgi:hypothetical protein
MNLPDILLSPRESIRELMDWKWASDVNNWPEYETSWPGSWTFLQGTGPNLG